MLEVEFCWLVEVSDVKGGVLLKTNQRTIMVLFTGRVGNTRGQSLDCRRETEITTFKR